MGELHTQHPKHGLGQPPTRLSMADRWSGLSLKAAPPSFSCCMVYAHTISLPFKSSKLAVVCSHSQCIGHIRTHCSSSLM